MDLRLLHRAGPVDVRSIRARVRFPDGPVAGRRADRHRHRRIAWQVARRGAEALHHPLHRGSAESFVSPHLLHVRVERGHHVRCTQYHWLGGGHRHRALASQRDLPGGVLSAGRINLVARRAGTTATREGIDQRRGARAALLLRIGLGGVLSLSPCCGCCGKCCRTHGRPTCSSWSSLSAFSPSWGISPAAAVCRARGPSFQASSPSPTEAPENLMKLSREGWEGWDEYAPFYDWENARTLGRRDVPFWRRVAFEAEGRVLELGCGTGRVSLPLARAGVSLVGIDRSAPMLSRARRAGPGSRATAQNPMLRPGRHRRCPSLAGSFRRCSRRTASCSRCSTTAISRPRSNPSLACSSATGHSASISCRTCRTGASTPTVFSCGAGSRRRASHAHRVGPSGPRTPPDDVRAALRGAPGRTSNRAPVRTDVPDAVGPADGATSRARRVSSSSRAWRLSRPPVGRACGRLDHPRPAVVRFSRVNSLVFLEFRHVRPFQVGFDQAQEGRR